MQVCLSYAVALFLPGERRISPAQDKKKSLIRRPKGIFTALITPIELRIRRPNSRNSPQLFWLSPTQQKQSKTPDSSSLDLRYMIQI